MSLSIFIDKHTVGAMAEPDFDKLGVLIDINRNIAGGLMTVPEQEPAQEQQPPETPLENVGGNILA